MMNHGRNSPQYKKKMVKDIIVLMILLGLFGCINHFVPSALNWFLSHDSPARDATIGVVRENQEITLQMSQFLLMLSPFCFLIPFIILLIFGLRLLYFFFKPQIGRWWALGLALFLTVSFSPVLFITSLQVENVLRLFSLWHQAWGNAFWVAIALGAMILGYVLHHFAIIPKFRTWWQALDSSVEPIGTWPHHKEWVTPPDIEWNEDTPAGKGENNP